MCRCVYMNAGAHRGERSWIPRAGLWLLAVVEHLMWLLRIRAQGRAVHSLNPKPRTPDS